MPARRQRAATQKPSPPTAAGALSGSPTARMYASGSSPLRGSSASLFKASGAPGTGRGLKRCAPAAAAARTARRKNSGARPPAQGAVSRQRRHAPARRVAATLLVVPPRSRCRPRRCRCVSHAGSCRHAAASATAPPTTRAADSLIPCTPPTPNAAPQRPLPSWSTSPSASPPSTATWSRRSRCVGAAYAHHSNPGCCTSAYKQTARNQEQRTGEEAGVGGSLYSLPSLTHTHTAHTLALKRSNAASRRRPGSRRSPTAW